MTSQTVRVLGLGIKYLFIALFIGGIGLLSYGYYHYSRVVTLGDRVVTIIVRPGDNFRSVADQLTAAHAVTSRETLWYMAVWRGIDKRLIPGRYDFTGDLSVGDILHKLATADMVMRKVVIPEGLALWETAAILARHMNFDSVDVMSLARDSQFIKSLDVPTLEGYLFPATYNFPSETDCRSVVSHMVKQFHLATADLWPTLLPGGLTRPEIVTLASIVEAETRVPAERPVVASVYLNRLRIGMKLDADPTVSYGMGGLSRPLLRRDLSHDSPYNTYMNKGLPPTPINSPGRAAIEASLRPAESQYLFFVANSFGGHQFSRTNAEHNVARLRARIARDSLNDLRRTLDTTKLASPITAGS